MIKVFRIKKILKLIIFLMTCSAFAQQDPQFTQYMYNTLSINSGYTGQRDAISAVILYRNQWVGLDGAPQTQTLGIHGPLRNDALGLGLSIVNDIIGPTNETYLNGNFSYTIYVDEYLTELSFGLNAGLHILNNDWTKGNFRQEGDPLFSDNINLTSPMIGAALYLHSENYYVGFSVPNFLKTEHYDTFKKSLATERMHFYLIGGYVFDINRNLKLKPAFLAKAVSGAPIIADISLNALVNEKVHFGLSYRWDDSFSGLVGFNINQDLFIGYAHDRTTTGLSGYNYGTHEIMMRYEFMKNRRVISPRFF